MSVTDDIELGGWDAILLVSSYALAGLGLLLGVTVVYSLLDIPRILGLIGYVAVNVSMVVWLVFYIRMGNERLKTTRAKWMAMTLAMASTMAVRLGWLGLMFLRTDLATTGRVVNFLDIVLTCLTAGLAIYLGFIEKNIPRTA